MGSLRSRMWARGQCFVESNGMCYCPRCEAATRPTRDAMFALTILVFVAAVGVVCGVLV